MASKYEEAWFGDLYGCGNAYAERGYYEGYPESFTRKSKDTAEVGIRVKTEMCHRGVRWISPGRYKWTEVWCAGDYIARVNSQQWDNCGNDWGDCSGIAEGVYRFTQTSSNRTNVNVYGRTGYQTSYGETSFWWGAENGWPDLNVEIGNNFRILPPKDLSGSITSKNARQVVAKCTLGSWSDNANIKGTPYTSDGGRNWNFQAVLKNGNSTIKTLTQNTGETKNATFTFSGLNLPIDTNLTITFTASNNYQQTISTTVTFKVASMGWVVTSSSRKKIKYISITSPTEDGGSIKYVSSIKKIT